MNDAIKVVNRESLGQFQRWAAPDMNPPPPPEPEVPVGPTVAELQAISEQARKEGFEQGLNEGRNAAQVELKQQIAELHKLYDALARPLAQVDATVERQLAELVTVMVRRVLETEMRLQPEFLLQVVRNAIAALPAATTTVEIHVFPTAAALLREHLDEAEESGWRIVEDSKLKPGDCFITGTDSRIDVSVETRLAALIDAALDEEGVALSAVRSELE